MTLLTIFTPTYNRKHTIGRTYKSLLKQTCKDFKWLIIDDGSNDGTREWVLSLGPKIEEQGIAYDWMGRPLNKTTLDHFVIESNGLEIEYVCKENGGLYTGYNVAYDLIHTELCVCIDSDDYLPKDAVEKNASAWNALPKVQRLEAAGVVGLDYNCINEKPIGGCFCMYNKLVWNFELHHLGDVKYVFRTKLMNQVAPQIGFKGEKDFNPHYMQMQVLDKYKILVVNENFCWVEYQTGKDSMSQAIFKQYKRSPRSYARYRLMELEMKKGISVIRKLCLHAHYVSACIFAHDREWLKNSSNKLLTLAMIPLGCCYNLFIRYKARL